MQAMSATMDAPDAVAPTAMAAPVACTLTVPLSMLGQPDSEDNMLEPAVGDKNSANIDFTVKSIQGQNAVICVDAVNGKELESGDEEAAPENEATEQDAQEGSQLRSMALTQ